MNEHQVFCNADRNSALGSDCCSCAIVPKASVRLLESLLSGIRKHRDQKGDDRCWMDDEELYKLLPEGYEPPVRDTLVELKNCENYIKCRHNPGTEYVSPQRRIEELEEKLLEAKERIALLEDEVVSEREDADYYRGAYLDDHDPPGEDW